MLTSARADECPAAEALTDPNSCKEIWEAIGLPQSLKDERPGSHTYICHKGFLTRYNHETKTPDWVIERLTHEMVTGTYSRPRVGFKPDPCVDEAVSALDDDYLNSLYARGHQAASDDFSFNKTWMKDTFFFSNAVPQEGGGFNSSVWRQFEDLVKDVAERRSEIYVITGPIYQNNRNTRVVIPKTQNPCRNRVEMLPLERTHVCGGTSGEGPVLQCEGGVAIPGGLFKILVDPAAGRTNAFVMPNIDHPSQAERGTNIRGYMDRWQVSILNVEDRTGYNFLPNLSKRERRIQEERCPVPMLR
eukprot:s1_g2533.t1